MILRTLLLIATLSFSSCETLPTSGMTAKEKITYYGCHYCKNASGFCCNKKVPEYDHNIFNCENATLFTKGCDKDCEE